ncbi:aldo/keto reductase [Leptolyngbya sp. FACHB-671]|uniref:aldo/keto reductase n=1 Tax=Leptolyngbya sp. FACHB-671 TaxID=2692812 RepID=UPI00168697CF|nr:aldo/keto reductase [Leptolyngbya sp. FACHB-671]MBD2070694.1 aldo/keto reductase [Leptolyngbya sp. FACHB-671]
MQTVKLVSGATMPVLGQGTWRMGENGRQRKEEVDALRFGVELGMTLIDTAEMYGEGGAEEIVGEAIAPNRDQIFLVSKVYPHNATRRGTIAACERSLKRLKTDYLDLYLLHWRGSTPLAETIEAFQELRQAGKIRDFGVSNFDRDDMEEAHSLDQGLTTTNQVLYNLSRRGIEWDLLPWCREQNVAVMAYSPLEQGRMLNNSSLKTIAERHHASAAQVAIAWLLQQGVIVIPKSSNRDRIRENYAALDLKLTDPDLTELNQAFPPPQKAKPLEVL